MNQRDLDMSDVEADAARMEDAQRAGAPDASSPEYRAGWAAEDAQEAADQAKIAAGHAAVETEIAAEDEMEAFRTRLAAWIRSQPDVAELEDLGMGIFGFALAGVPEGVSLSVHPTGRQDV